MRHAAVLVRLTFFLGILALTCSSSLAQETHVWGFPCQGYFGGTEPCAGDCEPTLFGSGNCELVGQLCQCVYGGGCGIEDEPATGPELPEPYVMTVSRPDGGTIVFEPGVDLLFTQPEAATVTVHHSARFGSALQPVTLPQHTINMTIHFTDYDPRVPERPLFDVTSFSATLPSFASVALGGLPTGVSAFTLSAGSWGYIVPQTGAGEIHLNLRLTNGIFTFEPSVVAVALRGTYDASTHHVMVARGVGDVSVLAWAP